MRSKLMENSNFSWQDYRMGLCTLKELSTRDRKIALNNDIKLDKILTIREMKDNGKEYHLSNNIIKTAYGYMLDTNCCTVDALEFSALRHQKDIELVLAEKSRSVKAGVIIKEYDTHPIQKGMIRKDVFNRQALKNSNNVWQLLNTLSTFRGIYERLTELELDIKGLKDRTTTLEVQLADAVYDLNQIKIESGINIDIRDKVRELYNKKHTNKVIAEVLDIPIRTVRRWTEDLD